MVLWEGQGLSLELRRVWKRSVQGKWRPQPYLDAFVCWSKQVSFLFLFVELAVTVTQNGLSLTPYVCGAILYLIRSGRGQTDAMYTSNLEP